MKKNLNKRSPKKALVPALLATLCSLGALTSVSYAWFTMGNTASVGQIDVNVQAADGMQISADASSWKSLLPVDELKNPELDNKFPAELKPVSTAGKLTDGALNMFEGTQINEKVETVATTENFIVFDLYIKLDNDKKLSLYLGSYVKDLVDEDHADKDSSLASRVAFVNEGVVTTGKPEDAKALKAGSEVVIWEPNATTFNKTNTNNKISGKQAYTGVNSAISLDDKGNYIPVQDDPETDVDESKATYESHFTTMETLSPTYDSNFVTTAEQELLNLKKGINKVRIYIWLEGQDVDCTNEIAEGTISVGLNFKVPEQPTVTPDDDDSGEEE